MEFVGVFFDNDIVNTQKKYVLIIKSKITFALQTVRSS